MNRLAPAVLSLTLVFAAPVFSRAEDQGVDQAAPLSEQAPAEQPAPAQGGRGLAMLQKRLGINDADFARLKKAWQDHRAVMQPLQKKGRELTKTLARQVRGKASDADVQKTLDSLDQNRKDIQAATDQFQKHLSFLTPTQRAKLLLGAMMRARHGWGMHPGMGRGGGQGPRNGSAPGGDQQQPETGGGEQGGGQ